LCVKYIITDGTIAGGKATGNRLLEEDKEILAEIEAKDQDAQEDSEQNIEEGGILTKRRDRGSPPGKGAPRFNRSIGHILGHMVSKTGNRQRHRIPH